MNMKKMRLFSLILGLLISSAFVSNAQLLEENFAGTAGDTLANGWVTHSGSASPIYIKAGTLSYTNYPSNSGSSIYMTSGQDYNKSFTATPISSGNVYFAALVNIDSAKATGDYFMHSYRTGAANVFNNRVYVKKATNGNLAFGVLKGSAVSSVVWTDSIYALSTTHLVVLKVQIVAGATNDIPSIFVNPVINGTEPSATVVASDITSTDYADIDRVALRQASASTCPKLTFDGLRIATTWNEAVGIGGGVDVTPPTVSSATALTATSVRVTFSEPVSQATAQNVANYTIVGNTISSAVLSGGNIVTLTLGTALTPSTNYTLTVNGVADITSTPNVMTVAQDFVINFVVNNVANIAELKTKVADNTTVYTLNSEAIMTFKQANRNQKFVQDATGAILIDDQAGIITTTYTIGDGITGIVGKLTSYYGQYQFVPTQNPAAATSTGNTIPVLDVTISEMLDSIAFKPNQSKLIRLVDASFTDANGSIAFATNKKYRITAGGTTDSTFKTTFFTVDYMTMALPQGTGSITGITQFLYGRYQITARDHNDISLMAGVSETNSNSINVYPNPTKNNLYVSLDGTYDITVISLLGQRVYNQNDASGTVRIDCSSLGKGVFFVQARNAKNQTITKRIVVE